MIIKDGSIIKKEKKFNSLQGLIMCNGFEKIPIF